eukprot:229511-Chlamydomonas_euryale.AAC.1
MWSLSRRPAVAAASQRSPSPCVPTCMTGCTQSRRLRAPLGRRSKRSLRAVRCHSRCGPHTMPDVGQGGSAAVWYGVVCVYMFCKVLDPYLGVQGAWHRERCASGA